MMRKVAGLVAAGILISSFATTSVAAPKERTSTERYTITRGQIHGSDVGWWIGTQPEFFRVQSGERWATVSLEDDSGRPVRGRVEVNGNVVEFCSVTPTPMRVRSGQKLGVNAIYGLCGGAFSMVTEGTITATFTR